MSTHGISPTELSPSQLYGLLVKIVVPRPIALVSTLSRDGVANLAPFSFFQLGGVNPPSVILSVTRDIAGEHKDTLRYIEETKEYVINTVDRKMAEGMNFASSRLASGESEWEISKFTKGDSEVVKPPRVLESPVQMECRLFKIVHHGNGSSSANYIIGEILRIHLRDFQGKDSVLQEDFEHRPIARLGEDKYLDTDAMEIFRLMRPMPK